MSVAQLLHVHTEIMRVHSQEQQESMRLGVMTGVSVPTSSLRLLSQQPARMTAHSDRCLVEYRLFSEVWTVADSLVQVPKRAFMSNSALLCSF